MDKDRSLGNKVIDFSYSNINNIIYNFLISEFNDFNYIKVYDNIMIFNYSKDKIIKHNYIIETNITKYNIKNIIHFIIFVNCNVYGLNVNFIIIEICF